MAWLRGSTDIANVKADIYGLLSGSLAASQRGSGQSGNGAQVEGQDVWEGIDGTNYVLRSKYTEKPWRLPIECWRGMPRFGIRSSGTSSNTPNVLVGKPTYSGAYTGTTYTYFVAYASTVNTSTGNLSGTVVSYTLYNSETNATIGSGTTSGFTGASDSKLLRDGVSITLTLGSTESLSTYVNWSRGYSVTYPQGVDYIPEAAKIKTTGTTVISSTSTGSNEYTLNTDYKIVGHQDAYPLISAVNPLLYQQDWGGTGVYSGIEWQAGGSPPAAGTTYYLVDCDMYAGYLGISFNSPNLFFTAMDYWDPNTQRGRLLSTPQYPNTTTLPTSRDNVYIQPNASLFSSAPAVTSTYINYWLSVQDDKLVMILRGDPAVSSGRMTVSTFQRFTPIDSSEKIPWVLSCMDQTDVHMWGTGHFLFDTPYYGRFDYTTADYFQPYYGIYNPDLNFIATVESGLRTLSNPNASNGKWWFYPFYPTSNYGGKDTNLAYTSATTYASGVRGTMRGIYAVANSGWSQLDELVDGADTYLMVVGYTSLGGASTNYLAILEE